MSIKLIASDMDGSLLTTDKRLPPDFFDVLEKLHQRGIRFVAASGRAYYTLQENFMPYQDRLDYLCENGAYASFEENIKGTITPGKLADFIIVDADPYAVEPAALKDISVLRTYLGGEITYEK